MGFFDWLFGRRPQPLSPAPPSRSTAQPEASIPVPPPPRKLDLNATDFLPIARDELKVSAQGLQLWGNPWFGRRDLIPPADDPRTKLIDRALVTHGLLTPEQLVDLHRVGDEMERVRPSLVAVEHAAALAGEAAVQADREQRAKIKVQKKADSLLRQKLGQKEMAERRATDIVFLGRGVSGRLGKRVSDLTKLDALGLPRLATPADMAAALNLSVSKLRWLAFHTDV